MGFLNPALLWGAALIGVPILIWLISRRWYQRREWAAMEFLLRALKKHRRRLQIENILLLAIRVAAILLLAAAMARPFLVSGTLAPVSKNQEENWVFAIDTSYSMGFKEGPRSLFEGAREMISDMIANIVKAHDRVAIVTLDADPRVVLRPKAATESNRAELVAGLGDLELTSRPIDLARSLDQIRYVASLFEPAAPGGPAILSKRILLFSDFQRGDWLGERGPRDPAVVELIRQIQDAGGVFSLADLKGSDRNLSLLDLAVSPDVIARDVWVQFRATVRNFGHEDFERVELVFSVDGQEESRKVLAVPAGETVSSPPVPYRFPEAGYHSVTAEIRSDGLVTDNRRQVAVQVREEAGILLVDGDPSRGPLDRETLHLQVALAPSPGEADRPAEGRLTPYRPVVRSADGLDDVDPREYALVILVDVGSFPDKFLRDLKAYVRDGGAVMVFVGKNVDPAAYNAAFGGEGGLLPGKLGEVVGDPRASFHLLPGDPDHPLVRYFESHRDVTSLLQPVVEFKEFMRADLTAPTAAPPPGPPAAAEGKVKRPGPEDTRVAFRYSDSEGSPAIFDRRSGQGRIMWITTTADRQWNAFPAWPDFVAFLYQSIPYLVRTGEARINLMVGEPFRQVFDAADYAGSCVLLAPGAAAGISKAMTKLEGENRFVLTHEDTWTPGVYDLRLSRPGAGSAGREWKEFFAVNVDPREGDLRRVTPDDFRAHFPVLRAEIFDAARELQEFGRQKAARSGTELAAPVLWAALALLLLETALAQFLGRRAR